MNGNRKTVVAGLSIIAAMVIQSGCAGPSSVAGKAAAQPEASPAAQKAETTMPKELSGKVTETMASGGYTYVLLEKDGTKVWVAMPMMKVAVGDELRLKPGMDMGKFTSKSLNKTFDHIIFTDGPLAGASSAPLPKGHPAIGAQAKPQETTAAADTGKVQEITKQLGNHAAMLSPGAPEEGPSKLAGKVVDSASGGGYTYVCLESNGQKTWAAVPAAKVEIGQDVELRPGTVMTNFTSKTLGKTFEKIVFSEGFVSK